MCGIVGIFDLKKDHIQLQDQVLKMSRSLRHRGPDWTGYYWSDEAILAHERLAIVDPSSGKQPLVSPDGQIVLAANGEIYNHKELRRLCPDYSFKTESDCEIIIALYQKFGVNFLDKLNGIFAFALYDKSKETYLISRDHMGIIPLYEGWDVDGQYYVASELKALEPYCKRIEVFLPGHIRESGKELQKWYERPWKSFESVDKNSGDKKDIHDALEAAVKRQLMSDVPYGVLLSGGLDSSVVSALAKKHASRRVESEGKEEAWYPQLHSFAIGLEGSPDLAAARKVADFIGTIHHEVHFTIEEGLLALSDVIYHLETYDITTIRASTPMYLLARVIKSMGIKMVLSGEGSDEIFGGYLYFHKAPDARAFHDETVRKLEKLHLYDCLRANKSLAAFGVEGRVPFLDKEFMNVAMSLDPAKKMCGNGIIEKKILREAFAEYLPDELVWRQKEQFSDGVGYGWIDALKDKADTEVSDEALNTAHFKFPFQPPATKEEYLYRSIFESHFPSHAAAACVPSVPSIACSSPVALEWDASFKNQNEPSGRAIRAVHSDSY